MVNNWHFILQRSRPPAIHLYTHYTGADGLWDLIQPCYLSGGRLEVTDCPIYRIEVPYSPGQVRKYDLDDVGHSYVEMVNFWLSNRTADLWTLDTALAAHDVLVKKYGDRMDA